MDIDNILEEDLMAALDGMDMTDVSSVEVSKPEPKVEEKIVNESVEPQTPSIPDTSSHTIEASSMDIAALLKELLNNKSLEITIKLKDN
jgi:hypothetical protein